MFIKKRAVPAPTDRLAMIRRPELAVGYRPWTRLADRFAGRTDGRSGVWDARDGAELTQVSSMWLATSMATLGERQDHEQLVEAAMIADIRTRLGVVTAEVDHLAVKVVAAQDHLAGLPEDPADLDRRGPAEVNIDVGVVHSRRRREYEESTVGPARTRVAKLAHLLQELQTNKRLLEAQIETVEVVTKSRLARLIAHYARRQNTYRRSYLRSATKSRRRAGSASSYRNRSTREGRP